MEMEILNTSSNTSSYLCESLYNGKIYLDSTQKFLLTLFLCVVIVLDFVANFAVVYALLTTAQYSNTSLRLVLFLSISDCGSAIIGLPLFVVMLTSYSDSLEYCNIDTCVEFFVILFAHVSAYMVGLIGYDRYFRIKYLSHYSQVVKDWKVYVAVATVMLLSLLQTTAQVLAIQFHVYKTMTVVAIAIDLTIILWMLVPYLLSLYVMRQHRVNASNQDMLKSVDNTITSLASRMLIAIIVFYIPYAVVTIMRRPLIDKSTGTYRSWLYFALFVGYELTFANSFANAIIFLTLNKKCRIKLFGVARVCIKLVPGISSEREVTARTDTAGTATNLRMT